MTGGEGAHVAASAHEIDIQGRRFRLSNLDKVLWPAAGFTKGDMIDYYRRVAPALLPHLAGRPLTLRRFPDGVEGWSWYQNQWPRGHPAWLQSQPLPRRAGGVLRHCLIDDEASLVWAANLAAIELHPLLALGATPQRPTTVVFDLDPGPPADILDCCRVGLALRAMLGDAGLAASAKTSGSVGLHVYVPLNSPVTYDDTKRFARAAAIRLAADDPGAVTSAAKRSTRAGKVLVDWLQNDPSRSTVAPYSLRAAGWPTVSTPVGWEEVERAVATGRPELLTFEPAAVLDRLERLGELFAPVLHLEQALPIPA